MQHLLEFGTIWFWIVAIVASGLIIYSTEEEENNWASNFWFVVVLLALYFLGNSETFKSIGAYMLHNPGPSLMIFVIYVALGTVWSIFKWFFYLRRIRDRYENAYSFDIKNYRVKENKERITHWMIYWPFSAIWTLINDPVRKTFEFVLSKFGGLYDSLSEKMLGDLKKK